MRQLDGAGSTLFSLTWRRKATPAGRPYYQLAASGRRISETDCGLWPSPMAGTPAQKAYNEAGNTDSSQKTVALCSWPTPTLHDADRGGQAKRAMGETRHGSNLQDFALLARPTPSARDWKSSASNQHGINARPLNEVARLASWPTPNTPSGGRSVDPSKMSATGKTLDGRKHTVSLEHVVRFVSWATPRATDGEKSSDLSIKRREAGKAPDPLPGQAKLSIGKTVLGSPAPTEKFGQLSPAHSRWLQGYLREWDLTAPARLAPSARSRTQQGAPLDKHHGGSECCVDTAMPSCPSAQRSSSAPPLTASPNRSNDETMTDG